MNEIHKKLVKIQSELNCPKNQKNTFGNYNYRSCEDIVEAAKPLLHDAGLSLLMTDEIINIGNYNYIQATVSISDGVGAIKVSAVAREADSRKGMDASQITGATSSYARKYALNGLFAIDDTKDADTMKPEKEEDKALSSFLAKVKDGKKAIGEDNFKKALDEYNTDSVERIAPNQRKNFLVFMGTFIKKEDR